MYHSAANTLEPVAEGVGACVGADEDAVLCGEGLRGLREEEVVVEGGVRVQDDGGVAVFLQEGLEPRRVLEVRQHDAEEVAVCEVRLQMHEIPWEQLPCTRPTTVWV